MQQPKISELKTGDKFTVEFTVVEGGYIENGDWRSLASIPFAGHRSYLSKWVPTSVTRAPRAPKAGDRYIRTNGTYTFIIVFIDDKSVVSEAVGVPGRFHDSRTNWDARETTHRQGPRSWLP